MKNLITILLLGVMLLHASSRFLLVMDYQANKDFITKFLCVNKSKPQLKCNGHCFLKKNLKKAAEAEKHSTNQSHKADLTLYCQAFFRIAPHYRLSQFIYLPAKPNLYQFASYRNTFHPPQITG